jgi:iron(III) transport system permease protein
VTRGAGSRRPPLLLAVAATVVVGALLLPLAYLIARVAGDAQRALEILGEATTWRLVCNTVLLVVGVVAAAVAIAVPLAWLVARTDLPGRRAWAVAGALPLVIPSYVAALCLLGFVGVRGLLADALGLEQVPDVTG